MTTAPRKVLAYFIATGDPPAPNANDPRYRGTHLSDSEKRENSRRVEREPLPMPKEHGKESNKYVINNVAGYVVPPEERMGDIYGALVPYDNRLLVLGRIYDCPEGREAIDRANSGIALGLSPYFENNVLEDASGNPIHAFDLRTTHYGLTIHPEFSAKNSGGDHRKGTYIHQLAMSEDAMLKELRERHLRDGVYVTPALQDKMGLDDATRARLKREFEDGIRIKRAIYQKIYDEPMPPDGFDASLLPLFVEPTVELTEKIPIKETLGESVAAILEARRAEEAARPVEEEEREVEKKAEEEGAGDALGDEDGDPMELEAPVLPEEPEALAEKLNSAPLADTVGEGENQSFPAATSNQPPTPFLDFPALRQAVTSSSLMSTTSPQDQQHQQPPPASTPPPQSSVHAPFRPAPASTTPTPSPSAQDNSNAMDIDEGQPAQSQQPPAPELTAQEVMQKLAEISMSAQLLSSGSADLEPREAYDTMTALEHNLKATNAWLRKHGMEPESLEDSNDFENYMRARREIGLMRKNLSQRTQADILSFDPQADVSMYTPEKILDPIGSGYRPEQYTMLKVTSSNVFSGKRRELEAQLSQKPHVEVNLQQGTRTVNPPHQTNVWGAKQTQVPQPSSFQSVNLKRRLPNQSAAQSAAEERPHQPVAVYQGESKRTRFADVPLRSYQPPPQQQDAHSQQPPVEFSDLGRYLQPEGVTVRKGSSVGSMWQKLHGDSNPTIRADLHLMRQYTTASSQTVDPGTLASMQRISARISGDDLSHAEQLLSDHRERMRQNPSAAFYHPRH